MTEPLISKSLKLIISPIIKGLYSSIVESCSFITRLSTWIKRLHPIGWDQLTLGQQMAWNASYLFGTGGYIILYW
jgi:hypothetical protein